MTDENETQNYKPINEKLGKCSNGKPCNLSFPSYHELLLHKKKLGHKRKGRKRLRNNKKREQKLPSKMP